MFWAQLDKVFQVLLVYFASIVHVSAQNLNQAILSGQNNSLLESLLKSILTKVNHRLIKFFHMILQLKYVCLTEKK